MTKLREISSERQKQEKYHWNDKNKKVIGMVKQEKCHWNDRRNLIRTTKTKNVIPDECDALCHPERM